MATQAREDMSHPPPPSKPGQIDQEGSGKPPHQQPQKAEAPLKTETEEKIEKETPRLNTDAAASASESSTQQDGVQHVTRRSRSKRHNPSKPLGQVGQQQLASHKPGNQQVQTKSSSGAPSVRLDMNLDVDIDLKAKIKGDVTVSVL
ncbi:hypothetical protein CSIM01_09603 [Colletotrichum simmondsii]|uniref:Uncharacterized protein n=1 Tax=Colletotrichum simmondsii TaxID=703756 RepID=A0A135T3D2_9PEZI|nr:hypothetical protein CSIM01_09603 [Colletotrichum simmondsii]